MDQDLVQRFPLAKQTYEAAESLGSPLPTHSTQVMRRVEDIIEPDGRRKIAFEAEARSDFIGLGLTVWLEDGELDIAEFYTLDGVVRWKRGSGLGQAHQWETEAAARSGGGGVGKHFPAPFIDGPFTGDPWELVREVLERLPDAELAASVRAKLEAAGPGR